VVARRAVLAPPLWGKWGSGGHGSPNGGGHRENFVGNIVKYAVFGIKPASDQ